MRYVNSQVRWAVSDGAKTVVPLLRPEVVTGNKVKGTRSRAPFRANRGQSGCRMSFCECA